MKNSEQESIAIIGGGIMGIATAIYLAKAIYLVG